MVITLVFVMKLTCLASSSLNFSSCKVQLSSSGLSRSHKTPLTLAITVFSAKPWDIPCATSYGEVCHDLPSLTAPSGNVIC